MFVVVESGSTKADWMILKEGQAFTCETKGFNPIFHNQNDILTELNAQESLCSIQNEAFELFFYGAGCNNAERNATIQHALEAFFKHAKVSVGSDLLAAALACYSGTPEIVCILGTGSNSCFYDGTTLHQATPSLGYVLGDEASGSYFGKALLSDFLCQRLPEEMIVELKEMGLTKDSVLEKVYREPNANVYLASFMPVLIKHKELDYSQALIRAGLERFVDVHVLCYDNCRDCEVNFVGSLAVLLERELREVCEEKGIVVGKLVQRPLKELVRVHG